MPWTPLALLLAASLLSAAPARAEIAVLAGADLTRPRILFFPDGVAAVQARLDDEPYREAAAVAMPNARLGEGVCAYLVLASGRAGLALDELVPYLEDCKLARQKWPERLEIVEELPKTASGKVRKDVLRQRIRERVQSGR